MEKGKNPLEFIQNNLKPLEQKIQPERIIEEVNVKRSESQIEAQSADSIIEKAIRDPEPLPQGDPPSGNEALPAPPNEKIPGNVGEGGVEAVADEAELSDVPNIPAPENFKRLRTKVKETRKELLAKEEALKEATTKLEQYETGELVPEVLQELENKAAEGEHYKKLHSLKTSREYKEKFIAPLERIGGKLKEIAKDYNLPESVMDQAATITNRAELNRFLGNHFDEIGALEVKGLITDLQGIQTEAQEAEAEPARVLATLMQEAEQTRQVRDAARKNKIVSTSKNAWSQALHSHKETNLVTELIPRENDPEFNKNFYEPIAQKAATEYGKIVRELAEAGLEELPDELAYAIAQMCQLAHATGVAVSARQAALEYAENIERNAGRANSIMRPSIGSPGGRSGGESTPTPKTPANPEEAAKQLTAGILSRRGSVI